MIYLDNAATTKVTDEVFESIIPYFYEVYANPSAIYSFAAKSRKAVDDAREEVASLIGAQPNEIYFTAGGSESDNWAIKAYAEANQNKGKHIITSVIEHHAVLHVCQYLEKHGFEVTYLKVDENGLISLDELKAAIRPDTILISIMAANNEIGTIEPLEEIGAIAKEHGANYLFEASCGGGIPIIRPLNSSLTADEIDEVTGILNGTTNYILSKMASDGSDFADVLKEAQRLGYAERNPEADVEGYDACRKIAILSSLAYGKEVNYEEVYTEGITKITAEDIKYATSMGTAIKLLATSRKVGDQYYAMVSPVMIDAKNPLYSVNGVFNAIFIHGNVLGDAMFYGSGAGKLPTASAVVADVVDCAKNKGRNIMMSWSEEKLDLLQIDDVKSRFFVRVSGHAAERQSEIEELFGKVEIVAVPSLSEEFAFITGEITEQEYREKAEKLDGIQSRIRARI